MIATHESGVATVNRISTLCDRHDTERPVKKVKTSVASYDSIEHEDTVPSHPLGVKPQGNSYAVGSAPSLRHNLGHFQVLPDEILTHFLDYLGARELLALGGTCKSLYAFCKADDLWRPLFVE